MRRTWRSPLAAVPLLLCALAARADFAGDLDPAALELASVHAAVADLGSGDLLYAKHADRAVPIASITKLMTAVVVIESGEALDEWLTIVDWARRPPANAYSRMRIGSQLRRADLLLITLMSSENRAAYVLARHHPGGEAAFVAAMNAKAAELGMTSTTFVDASGLSADNRSTAGDLLKLIEVAVRHELIAEYSSTPGRAVEFRNPGYSLHYGNTNVLVHRDGWDVVLSKTGYLDAAGRCLAMVAQISGRNVAIVLLDSFGTRTPSGDAGRISRWLRTGAGGTVASAALEYERRRLLEPSSR